MPAEFKVSLIPITILSIRPTPLWTNPSADCRNLTMPILVGSVLCYVPTTNYVHGGMRWTFCFLERCAHVLLLRTLDIFSLLLPCMRKNENRLFLAGDLSAHNSWHSVSPDFLEKQIRFSILDLPEKTVHLLGITQKNGPTTINGQQNVHNKYWQWLATITHRYDVLFYCSIKML